MKSKLLYFLKNNYCIYTWFIIKKGCFLAVYLNVVKMWQIRLIFRKFQKHFSSVLKLFGTLDWAFPHPRSHFWPFWYTFDGPKAPRIFCKWAPKSYFRTTLRSKMFKKVVFSCLKTFNVSKSLKKGQNMFYHPRCTCMCTQHVHKYTFKISPSTTGDSEKQKFSNLQSFVSCAYVCTYLLWGNKSSITILYI